MTKTPTNIFGEIPAFMESLVDINQHKKILDNLALAVFLVDEDLCIKYLNPAAEEIVSTGVRHALGRPLTDFIQDTDDELINHIQDSIRKGHPITQREVCMKRLGGGELIIDCSTIPILTKDEETLCLLEISKIDHMVRISREEHLLSETQATQNMLRGLAHEIKNPLGGVRGAAQLLAGELVEASLREYTDVIINEADRLRKLVDRMFGPNVTPVKQSLNVHNVLEHIRHLALAETPSGVEFKVDYDPSIPEIHADRDLLVQAILNIVRNAVRASISDVSNEKPEVQFKTRVLRQYTLGDVMHRLVVEISVTDNGPGVSAELKPQIFFPMVSGNEHGTGLGLPISQNLINLHNGLIEFDSMPGHTQFRVLLPLNNEDRFNI
ncbi:MAG: nitrogen regulation protein NR(II) [Gammaproteobacteria bacterium]|nr:nitrogen regulation protein NR(II) [Gammaproteobacteria bacterium]